MNFSFEFGVVLVGFAAASCSRRDGSVASAGGAPATVRVKRKVVWVRLLEGFSCDRGDAGRAEGLQLSLACLLTLLCEGGTGSFTELQGLLGRITDRIDIVRLEALQGLKTLGVHQLAINK